MRRPLPLRIIPIGLGRLDLVVSEMIFIFTPSYNQPLFEVVRRQGLTNKP